MHKRRIPLLIAFFFITFDWFELTGNGSQNCYSPNRRVGTGVVSSNFLLWSWRQSGSRLFESPSLPGVMFVNIYS